MNPIFFRIPVHNKKKSLGLRAQPQSPLTRERQVSCLSPDLNPLGTWMEVGLSILAWTKAFWQSMEMVFHFKMIEITRKVLTVLQKTTGELLDSSTPCSFSMLLFFSRSPLTASLPLTFLTVPSGLRLILKTQVVGMIWSVA